MPTIAFSHKGGYWKTRYSFYSYCYSFLDRLFLSYNMQYGSIQQQSPQGLLNWDQPVWLHDTGPGNCAFYGLGYGSQIAVTFNERPSSNKIYKALSLESTNNVTGVTAVAVNNSTGNEQTKTANVNVLEDKGGIMYADLGRQNESSGANIKLVGGITSTTQVSAGAPTVMLGMNYAGGSYNHVAQAGDVASYLGSTRYFFGSVVDGELVFHIGDVNTPIDIPQDYTAFAEGDPPHGFAANGIDTVNESVSTSPNLLGVQYDAGNNQLGNLIGTVALYPTALYSISPEAINGADPKGQTVDAVIQLGAANYELYALNLEYELTDYDHSDEKTRFAANRLRGRRSRKSASKK